MAPEGRRLFDGQHLQATLFDGTGDALMVTFDFRSADKRGFGPVSHVSGFARRGFSQLAIRTARNDWFINPETRALEDILQRLRGYNAVRLLGYSMGGYGAFRFARALAADTVVAVSPQVSIAPDAVPFDRRFRKEAATFDAGQADLAPHGMPTLRGVLLTDPFHPADMAHARAIARHFPGIALARLPFGGHPCQRYLRAAGTAWTVQRTAMEDAPSPTVILQAYRRARRGQPDYWDGLARHAAARRPALAARAAATAARLRSKQAPSGP
jgi:pimeloyl-ACP methyl ester carboxylesterase